MRFYSSRRLVHLYCISDSAGAEHIVIEQGIWRTKSRDTQRSSMPAAQHITFRQSTVANSHFSSGTYKLATGISFKLFPFCAEYQRSPPYHIERLLPSNIGYYSRFTHNGTVSRWKDSAHERNASGFGSPDDRQCGKNHTKQICCPKTEGGH